MHPRVFLASLEQFGIKLGLDQIQALLATLDHPERAFPAISIVGTNGKGSVTAMLERGLRAAGYRTGRYTSPHLIDLEERFALDGQPVTAAVLDAALGKVQAAADTLALPPTYFEATTAAALLLFSQVPDQSSGQPAGEDSPDTTCGTVDVALLEAGLGGRLDATNVVDAVAVVVTAIDFDHQEHLGYSIGAIAAEKAAVIKPGSVVVAAADNPAALDVVRARCAAVGASLETVPADGYTVVGTVDGRAQLRIATATRDYGTLVVGLRGRHQAANAMAAIRMLEALDARGLFAIGSDAIRTAVEDVTWPGRLESIDVSGTAVVVDGAHNAAAAAALAAYLRDMYGRRLPIVIGVLGDKDAGAIVTALAGVASRMVATAPSSPRAMSPADLAAVIARSAPGVPVDVRPSPAEAITAAAAWEAPVIVAGSLYLAGEVRTLATDRRRT